jgi:hypothetical protein
MIMVNRHVIENNICEASDLTREQQNALKVISKVTDSEDEVLYTLCLTPAGRVLKVIND